MRLQVFFFQIRFYSFKTKEEGVTEIQNLCLAITDERRFNIILID